MEHRSLASKRCTPEQIKAFVFPAGPPLSLYPSSLPSKQTTVFSRPCAGGQVPFHSVLFWGTLLLLLWSEQGRRSDGKSAAVRIAEGNVRRDP